MSSVGGSEGGCECDEEGMKIPRHRETKEAREEKKY